MKYGYIALILLLALSACTKNEGTKTLSRDNLKTQEFAIHTDRDTTLKTANGALINIPKGAIVSDNGSTITLQIKEAYSPKDMVLAGLTTKSGDEPLSSGGMIYVNTAPGQSARIVKPIRIAVPSNYRQAGMQLYKGDTSSGSIDWQKPSPLPDNAQSQTLSKGETLFKTHCTSCHTIGGDLVGPDLAHFEKRFPYGKYGEQNARYWNFHDLEMNNDEPAHRFGADTTKPGILPGVEGLQYNDLYACNLISRYRALGTPQDLKFEELKAIYDYIQNESDRRNLPLPSHAYLKDCTDSCKAYNEAVGELEQQKAAAEQKRNDLVTDNGPMTINKDRITPIISTGQSGSGPGSVSIDYDSIVSPLNANAEYYQFTIESFGWYNVDILLKNLPGVEPAELFVQLANRKWDGLSINLILPSIKANISGGKMDSEDKYVFYKKDGKIPLPIGAKGYILALSESNGEMAYGINSFIVSKSQQLAVGLQKTTKEEFAKAMAVLDEEGLKVTVADSKNADELRKTDGKLQTINENLKKAESLKPKRCDCECNVLSEQNTKVDTSRWFRVWK
jgi:mono/diheme cytochrome c family protein